MGIYTGVCMFLGRLVPEFRKSVGEKLDLASSVEENEGCWGPRGLEILIFPLKIMVFEQQSEILDLWKHSEGFWEVPRGFMVRIYV